MNKKFITYMYLSYPDKVSIATVVSACEGWQDATNTEEIIFIKGISAYCAAYNYVMLAKEEKNAN